MLALFSLFIPSELPQLSLASIAFCAFFAVSLALYYLLPRVCQWGILLLSSIIFFVFSCNPLMILYLLGASIIAYFTALLGTKKKVLYTAGILAVLAILVILKYANFLVINYNYAVKILRKLFHANLSTRSPFSFLAPLGLSFYTLMLIGYIADCQSGKQEPERNFFKFLLFTCYWPQMTSGPISRYGQLSPQIYERRSFDCDAVSQGIVRMTWGFFQKLVIAGHAVLIQEFYLGEVGKYEGFYVWIGMAAGVLQLYSDFNGCMDIVLGASECFGIRLPEKFNVPFAATTVTEFWRRWHITLGRWLHDYVFFRVMGSKLVIKIKNTLISHKKRKLANKIAMYGSSGVVWLCMGLWHGGTWRYIIGNGLWYYLVTTIEQECMPLGRKLTAKLGIKTDTFSWRLFCRFRTFVLFCIGTSFFYTTTMLSAFELLVHSIRHFNPLVLFTISLEDFQMNYLHRAMFVMGVIALIIVDSVRYCTSLKNSDGNGSVRAVLQKQNAFFRWILYWGMLTMIILSSTLSTQEFLYAQF